MAEREKKALLWRARLCLAGDPDWAKDWPEPIERSFARALLATGRALQAERAAREAAERVHGERLDALAAEIAAMRRDAEAADRRAEAAERTLDAYDAEGSWRDVALESIRRAREAEGRAEAAEQEAKLLRPLLQEAVSFLVNMQTVDCRDLMARIRAALEGQR